MRITIAVLIIGLILVSGCLGSVGGGQYATDYLGDMTRIPISNITQADECDIGSCYCMVCKNGTNIFGPLTNLIGGYCYFEKDCNQETARELSSNAITPTLSIQRFMVGQGPTFSDFSAANPYCSYRLGMAVQWLTATEQTPYTKPDPARAMCLLSKDIIPVYVLYSKGKNIDIDQTLVIAQILGTQGDNLFLGRLSTGPVGPVIVVTEIDFNESQAGQIAEQVRVIDEGCGNDRANNNITCFIAVAPKIGDTKALDAVMELVEDRVDFVAYGVNGNYVHSCSGQDIVREALAFSSYALYNRSKPSIIPYVMFDTVGSDAENTCTWDERKMQLAYSAFWPHGIIELQKRGLVGVAPYSFNATTYGVANPLGCFDCGIGKDENRLSSWYNWCQAYMNITRKLPGGPTTSHPSASTPIIFPNATGGPPCSGGANFAFITSGISYSDASGNPDIMSARSPALREPTDTFFTCDTCVIINATREPPFNFTEWTRDVRYACEVFPEIDQWAGQRNLDPMLVRAFVLLESNFDRCAASRVCREDYDDNKKPRCFPRVTSAGGLTVGASECYDEPAYNKMFDPVEEFDPAESCRSNLTNALDADSARPQWRWCALGIMQTITPPYTYWPAEYHPDEEDGENFGILRESGFYNDRRLELEVAKSCAPDGEYNPFNVSHSICMGTYKLRDHLTKAEAWVRSNHDKKKLNWDKDDFEKDAIFAAYVAGLMYTGFWQSDKRTSDHPRCATFPDNEESNGDCWADGFAKSWPKNASTCVYDDSGMLPDHCERENEPIQRPPYVCYGYTDFVKYVEKCELPFLHRQVAVDPGSKRMGLYYWLTNNCEESFCPEGKRLIVSMCKPDEITGYYPDDLCDGPNLPKILNPDTGSGTPYIQ